MIIEETFTIEAPVQKVWDFFLNVDQMSKCVPGAQVKQIDAENYEGALSVKVGPIGADFSGSVTLTQQTPPTALEATLKAKDKMTGSMVQGKFTSALQSTALAQTQVRYTIDVTIRGKLGQFGQTVIQDTAKRISGEFVGCVKAQIETPEGAEAPPPMTVSQAGGVATKAFLSALVKSIAGWFRRLLGREVRS